MKIKAVAQAEITATGVRITLIDSNGLPRVLDLSPHAEQQLTTALLAVPPAQAGKPQVRGPLVAENIRLYESSDGPIVLEAFLTEKASVHIALPAPLPEKLRELLGQNPDTWRSKGMN